MWEQREPEKNPVFQSGLCFVNNRYLERNEHGKSKTDVFLPGVWL